MNFPSEGKILTAKEAAELLKVTVQTIKNYIYQGKLKAFKTPGGHHRILESELMSQLETLMGETIKENVVKEEPKVSAEPVTQKQDIKFMAVNALLQVLDKRQNFPWGHSKRVADYVSSVATKLGLSPQEAEKMELAALLHDIGKIEISDDILAKSEKLTADEFDIIKQHPAIGETIVNEIEALQETGPLIRAHHERFDGKGYPNGVAGDNIPLGGRIIAIAEIFDGLTSKVPFHEPFSRDEAIDILKKESGKQLDPRLVGTFIEAIGKTA
jgi:excisionase family DNA binding protein/putative nucleotidyltransferase with HDIG domain